MILKLMTQRMWQNNINRNSKDTTLNKVPNHCQEEFLKMF